MLGPVPASRRANAFADALEGRRPGEAPAERSAAEQDIREPGAPSPHPTDGDPRDAGAPDPAREGDSPAPPDTAGSPTGPPTGTRPPDADHAGPPHGAETDLAEHTALLALAAELRALPQPELSTEAKTTQRAALVAAMERGFDGATTDLIPEQRRRRGAHRAAPARAFARLRPRTRWGKGLAAGGLSIGVAAGALGGAAAASTNALPGDTLYGLKRGMEDLRMDLASGDTDRGELHLRHASTRLGETRRLLERQRSGDLDQEQIDEVRRTLTSMHENAEEGHRLLSGAYHASESIEPLRSLSAFNDEHTESWSELRTRLPVELSDLRDEVSTLFEAMEGELQPLRSLLPESERSGQRAGEQDPPQESDGSVPESPPEDKAERAEPEDGGTTGDEDGGTGAPGDPTAPRAPEILPETPAEEPSEEGLLGGGGLLDPPLGGAPEDREAPAPDEPGSPGPEPEATVPPLLDGLLPRLGLEDRTPR